MGPPLVGWFLRSETPGKMAESDHYASSNGGFMAEMNPLVYGRYNELVNRCS